MTTARTRIRIGMPMLLLRVAVAAMAATSIDVLAQTPTPARSQTVAKPQAPAAHAAVANPPAGQVPAPAAPRSPSAPGGEVIARVGDTDIKEERLRTFVAGLSEREQAALARDPALLSQIVRSLLANQLVLKEAIAKKWDQRPEVAEQLQRAREIAIVESYLRSISQPPADFPSDAAIQNAYDANKSAFLVPRQFSIAQIYVALPGDADKATLDQANKKFADIQLKLKQPDVDFAAIARTESDAKEAADRGGEIGWVPETQLRPEIKAQIIGLAKNAVSEPIKLEDGWHIVKLIDTKAAYTRPIAEVRDQLVQQLRDERAGASKRAYLTELLKQSPPAINELALAKILSKPDQAVPR
jgi:parvulin-like peptidyl-prolyl isomerase